MEILRKYGESATILFPLIDAGANDFEATPVTHASGDTQISKDEGAFGNTTNAFAHEGNGIYSLVLTATEMQAARVVVTIVDQGTKAWEDQAIVISTYGHASAQHAFDLDTATQGVNVTQWRGSTPNNLQSGRVDSYLGAVASGVIAAASFAAGAFDAVWTVATRVLTAGTNIVLVKGTGITGFNDLSAAQVNAEVVDVLRTDTIPDSYAVDGTQPTIAQAILAIHQFLQERAVSGTTVTVKKPDGSTTAMTFTLDDGTNPTSITRAT